MRMSKSEDSIYYLLSFILGASIYFLFLFFSGVVGNDYVIFQGDAFAQNIAGLKYFISNILGGNGITYSWTSFLGANNYINLANGMIFSVSTPFYLIFNQGDFALLTVILLSLKAGLSSLFFYLYIYKIWKKQGLFVLVFSVSYALCAFQTAYVPQMYYFEDAVFMLPLVLYLVSLYAESGNYKLMAIAFLYSFLNVFYTGYIIGFFSLIYLMCYMFIIKRYSIKKVVYKLVYFAIIIVLVAGVSAVILYPMAYYIFNSYLGNDQVIKNYSDDILKHLFFNQLFIGQNDGVYSKNPYIYCGILSIIFTILYFINRNILRSEKLFSGILLGLMFLSCYFKPLYLFWHCFDYPDGFYFRFTFLISFLLCFFACRESEYIMKIKANQVLIVSLSAIIIYVLCTFLQLYFVDDISVYWKSMPKYLILNIIYICIYLIFILIFVCNKGKNASKLLLLIIVSTELVINGKSAYTKADYLKPEMYSDTYELWDDANKKMIDQLKKEDNSFYRIACDNDWAMFGAQYFNYNGLAGFSSFENRKIKTFLYDIGILTSDRIALCHGLTDFSKMILGIKYDFESMDLGLRLRYPEEYVPNINFKENDNVLSLGFLVNESIKDFSFEGSNQFNNINEFASCLIGKDIVIYDESFENLDYKEDGVYLLPDEQWGLKFSYENNDDEYGLFTFFIPNDMREAYAQFDYGVSLIDSQAPYIADTLNKEINDDLRITTSYIIPMDLIGNQYGVSVCMNNNTYKELYVPNIYFAYYNYDSFIEVYDLLKDNQLEVVSYGNGWIDGHINAYEDNKVLFTSIPYDEGWEIRINGEKTEPLKLLGETFIGLEIPRGNNNIEFRYHVPGFKTGLCVSVISSFIIFFVFISNPKIKVKNEERI